MVWMFFSTTMVSLATCSSCVTSSWDRLSRSSFSSSSSSFLYGGKSTSLIHRHHKPKFSSAPRITVCEWTDFIGGDLLRPDRGKFQKDLEEYGSIAIYPPPEGGYDGRYATKLACEGYHIMPINARGLGDLESYLTKVHEVRPPHLGKQPIAVWYFPPIVDYRLSLLPKTCKGLVLWVYDCKILSKAELQFLTLLPALRPKVLVVAECGGWRKLVWRPLKDIAGTPTPAAKAQTQQAGDEANELVLVTEASKEPVRDA